MKKSLILFLSVLFFIILIYPVHALEPYFNATATWIQDAGWPRINKYSLSNIPQVIDDLTENHIKYAIVMVGYYNVTSPTNKVNWQRTTTGGYMDNGPPNATFYTSVVNALHAANITAIAWIEDSGGAIDVSPSNWDNLKSQINMTFEWGFDGYSDDIETITGTHQDYIDWLNNITIWLHSMNKLSMPAVGLDWLQNTNQYLHVDYIVTMFYGGYSAFEQLYGGVPQGHYLWQENFGQFNGHNTPPASPVIMGIMNYYGNDYPLAWQLSEAGYCINAYAHPNLAGFSIWLYEYMGTNPTDWRQWNYWIMRVNDTYHPPLSVINISTSPISRVPMTFEGSNLYKAPYDPFYSPESEYLYNGTYTLIAPTQTIQEIHYSLFGDSDNSGGSTGYPGYAYAGGPYNLTSSASVNSLNFFCTASGNVKIAIYNATYYYIESWEGSVTMDGYHYHPYALLTESDATACTPNSWISINIQPVQLSPGIYFIAVKASSSLMTGASGLDPVPVNGLIYGYNQYITQNYNTPFDQIFPIVEGSMGNEPSVYIPVSPYTSTTYSFQQWENENTNPTRYLNPNGNTSIIAYYTTGPAQSPGVSGRLLDKNNNPLNANISAYQNMIIVNSSLTSNGYYDLTVTSDIYDLQYNILSMSNFFIKLISLAIQSRLQDAINYVMQYTNRTVFTANIAQNQQIQVYSSLRPKRILKNGINLTETSSIPTIPNTWFFNSSESKIYIFLGTT